MSFPLPEEEWDYVGWRGWGRGRLRELTVLLEKGRSPEDQLLTCLSPLTREGEETRGWTLGQTDPKDLL